MLSRLAMGSTPIISASLVRSAFNTVPARNQVFRQFQRDSRETVFRTRSERIAERQTLKQRIMAPAGPNGKLKFRKQILCKFKVLTSFLYFVAFAMGKGALAGGSVLALGALCYYGVGMGSQNNLLNQSMYVRVTCESQARRVC